MRKKRKEETKPRKKSSKPIWNKDKKLSKKHRKSLSLARLSAIGNGLTPWNKGLTKEIDPRVFSEKQKLVSIQRRGEKHSLKTRKLMSISHTGMRKPWRHNNWLGENNPRWSGGLNDQYYPRAFFQIRNKILKRDKECIKCSEKDDLVVHHIDKDKKNNVSSNLVTLCRICHTKLHITKRS